MEIWKDIKGYEGIYQVSNMGRIKSLNYRRTGKEGILNPTYDKDGYLLVYLYKNKKMKCCKVHRLVAIEFLPNPNNLPEVNHIDENKENNTVYNLEWCTSKYNINYGTRTEKCSKTRKGKYLYDKHPMSRKVKCITTGEIFNSMKEACEKYNINNSGMTKCCKGKCKYAGKHPITKEKLVWQYIE